MNRKFSILLLFLLLLGPLKAQNWVQTGGYFDRGPYCFFNDTTSGSLYLGGAFQSFNGQPADGIIKFDGQDWSSLPSGNPIYSVWGITRFNSKLCIYGGGGIGVFDGQSWTQEITDGAVRDINVIGSNAIVSGIFDVIGGDSIQDIALWDGVSFRDSFLMKSSLDSGSVSIASTQQFGPYLYAGGNINGLGSRKEIMRWDGSIWSSLGNGVGGGGSAWVHDLEIFQGDLYVGGYFSEQYGAVGNNIARWDGYNWSRLGSGLENYGQVNDLFVFQDKLYAVGTFGSANGIPANGIASWDGNNWCTYGTQIDNAIGQIASFQNELYITGGFWTIDNDSIRFLAKWIGSNYTDSCSTFPVQVVEEESTSSMSLFPNPAQSEIQLLLPNEVQSCDLIISDVRGASLFEQNGYTKGKIDVSNFPSGIYFVTIHAKGQSQVLKLAIQ